MHQLKLVIQLLVCTIFYPLVSQTLHSEHFVQTTYTYNARLFICLAIINVINTGETYSFKSFEVQCSPPSMLAVMVRLIGTKLQLSRSRQFVLSSKITRTTKTRDLNVFFKLHCYKSDL
jgi:hypothetical protein